MRTTLLGLSLLSCSLASFAQCTFDVSITPDDAILCPDEEVELSTQVYDSYQWYRDDEPIDGATAQTYTATSMEAGSMFSVEVTLDGCTETSPGVLVDGWMFLLPYLIHGGDEPYEIGPNGESFFCVGDTMTFELGSVSANVTWFNNGEPIPGETGTSLTVTTTGSYTASGAPAICPNFIMGVGVDVAVVFTPPTQPLIIDIDGQLCPFPAPEVSTQWYLDGEPYSTEDCIQAVPGSLTVFVDYGEPCQVISEPFVVTGVQDAVAASFSVRPVPATDAVRITWSSGTVPRGTWQLMDMTGRVVRNGGFSGLNAIDVDVRSLAPGKYWFSAPGSQELKPVPVAVVR